MPYWPTGGTDCHWVAASTTDDTTTKNTPTSSSQMTLSSSMKARTVWGRRGSGGAWVAVGVGAGVATWGTGTGQLKRAIASCRMAASDISPSLTQASKPASSWGWFGETRNSRESWEGTAMGKGAMIAYDADQRCRYPWLHSHSLHSRFLM
jgi:hypothetical protein